jgi:AcrR family transcriptional regulator
MLRRVMTRARPDLRQAIIHASIDLGSQLGEDGLTMRSIAARLGISATALYQHFDSKSAILREIRIYGLELAHHEVVEPASSITDPIARIRALATQHIHFARRHPWLYTVLMEHEQVDYEALTADERSHMMRPLDTVRGWLRDARDGGAIAADIDPDMTSLRIMATLHGLCSLLISGRIDENHPAFPIRDHDDFIRDFIESMLRGLAPKGR